jgi:hypothetical protein
MERLPEMISLNLDMKNVEGTSLRASHLKLFFESTLRIIEQSKEQIDVLFVCDDLNLLHKECLAILGESGHQVYY